jgi:hypothetical protein
MGQRLCAFARVENSRGNRPDGAIPASRRDNVETVINRLAGELVERHTLFDCAYLTGGESGGGCVAAESIFDLLEQAGIASPRAGVGDNTDATGRAL